MKKSFFKIALRKITRHKFFALLNIFGLSLAMACGFILFQFISYHTSFDRHHAKGKQLYRIVSTITFPDNKVIYDIGSPLAAGEALQNQLPVVKSHAELLNLRTGTVEVMTPQGKALFAEHDNISFTSQQFFNLFDYRFLYGSATALNQAGTIVITKALAEKYFNTHNPVSKTLTLNGQLLTVAAVIANPPANTDVKTALFVSRASYNSFFPGQQDQMMHDWSYIASLTQSYIQVASPGEAAKAETALNAIKKDHFDASVEKAYRFYLQPLADIHFNAHYGAVIQPALLYILGVVAAFLVLIACFNFINFATAQSIKRAKEIGTRKVLGSTPKAIFWQFITETIVLVAAACIVAFVWILLLRPFVTSWLQVHISLNVFQDARLGLCIGALFAFMVFGGGFYPALVLSRFKPIDALRQSRSNRQTGVLRNGLVVLQNVIMQVLIICVILIAQQVGYLKSAGLGFDKDAIMLVPLPVNDKTKMEELKARLRVRPQINNISFCWQAPSSEKGLGGSVRLDNREWEDFSCRAMAADTAYLNTFKLQLIAGTNVQPADTVRQFVITELFAHKLGFKNAKDAIGHQLTAGNFDNRQGMIVGVLKDFKSSTLYKPLDPVFITTELSYYRYAAIKLNAGNAATIDDIRRVWAAVYPSNVFEYHFADEQIDAFYRKEGLLGKLVNTSAAIAIIISCLGLLGLISFSITNRTKEIGIRKVLGASTSSIVYILFKNFLKLLLLSAVIAMPLAWWAMHQWLLNFAYHVNISWWVFAVAIALSVIIAFVTMGAQAVKAAVKNPVESLKLE